MPARHTWSSQVIGATTEPRSSGVMGFDEASAYAQLEFAQLATAALGPDASDTPTP